MRLRTELELLGKLTCLLWSMLYIGLHLTEYEIAMLKIFKNHRSIIILDRYLPAYPPTIHQMQMRMYISALRMMNVASWVWPGFGQHVIVQEDTDHLSMNIWGMMLQLRLCVIYCIYIY